MKEDEVLVPPAYLCFSLDLNASHPENGTIIYFFIYEDIEWQRRGTSATEAISENILSL